MSIYKPKIKNHLPYAFGDTGDERVLQFQRFTWLEIYLSFIYALFLDH